jgi:hypothetical protein
MNGVSLLKGLVDVSPAGLQTFLNPCVDIFYGLALVSSETTRNLSAVLVLVQFLCWLSCLELCRAFLPGTQNRWRRAAAFVVAVTGSCAVSVSFTTFNDWIVAACLCWSVRWLVLEVRDPLSSVEKKLNGFSAGFAMAAACAVKLTSLSFAVILLVASLVLLPKSKLRAAFLGGVAGFGLLILPWMIVLQVRYGSLFFPFYNGIFKANSATQSNFSDGRFGANSVQDILEFPFNLVFGTTDYSELRFREFRFAAFFLLVGFASAKTLLRENKAAAVFLWSLIGSTVVWLLQFGIYRYLLPIELLTSIGIVLLTLRLVPSKWHVSAFLVFVVGLAFQESPNWGRNGLVTGSKILLPSDSTVLLALGPPQSFIGVRFPMSTKVVAVESFGSVFVPSGKLYSQLKQSFVDGAKKNRLFVVLPLDGIPVMSLPSKLGTLSDCTDYLGARPFKLCKVSSVSI